MVAAAGFADVAVFARIERAARTSNGIEEATRLWGRGKLWEWPRGPFDLCLMLIIVQLTK